MNIDSKHSGRQTLISSRTAFLLLNERNFLSQMSFDSCLTYLWNCKRKVFLNFIPKIIIKHHENNQSSYRHLFAILAFAKVWNLEIRGKNPRNVQFEKSAKICEILTVAPQTRRSEQEYCTATAIPFIYSFSGNCSASAPISTFTCLWAIYLFPGSVYIFPPAEKADPSVGIYNSLTDT